MDLLQRHRTALFDNFSAEFSQLDRELRAELARRDATAAREKQALYDEIDGLRSATSNANELQQENQWLRAELQALTERGQIQSGPPSATSPIPNVGASTTSNAPGTCGDSNRSPAPLSPNSQQHYVTLKRRLDSLWGYYNKACNERDQQAKQNKLLNEQYSKLLTFHNQVLAKYRVEKDTIKAWSRYIARHKHEVLEETTLASTAASSSSRSNQEPKFARQQDTTGVPTAVVARIPELAPFVPMNALEFGNAGEPRPEGLWSHHPSASSPVTVPPSGHASPALATPEPTATAAACNDEGDSTDGEAEVQQNLTHSAAGVGLATSNPASASPIAPATDAADAPVVVSSRGPKRKRLAAGSSGNIDQRVVHQSGSAPRPIEIKDENDSSSLIGLAGIELGQVNDSIDLDEIGQKIDTPKKRRRLQELLEVSQEGGQSVTSAHPNSRDRVGDRNSSSSTAFSEVVGSESRSTRPADSRVTQSFQSDKRREGLRRQDHSFRSSSEPRTSAISQHLASDTRTSNTRGRDNALKPTTTNIRIVPRTSGHAKKAAQRSSRTDRTSRSTIFAEDGDESSYANMSDASRKEKPGTSIKSEGAEAPKELQQRLISLLDHPNANKKALKSSKSFNDASVKMVRSDADAGCPVGTEVNETRLGAPTATPCPRPDSRDSKKTKPARKSRRRSVSPRDLRGQVTPLVATDPDRPESEPYRARPLHRLSLEHFKLNPEVNQGLNYAFSETVRTREQRKCLPACTRRECCGAKFRKLVELGGQPTPQQKGPQWRSADDDEEQRLLQDYLGHDRDRLKGLTEAERRELLLQARTRQFADKHGRHRNAHERGKTPPGFWRTEMPSTQELEEDREEARKMERQKVEERYREAMRPGSKWVFRDE